MDPDYLLVRYFGDTQPSRLSAAAQAAGVERLRTDFRFEQDRGTRFALWALMHMLGIAPDLDTVFESADDRDAARTFADLLAAGEA
ncbi:hypothetical protein [Croceicoccus naphthovorans]|uniref:Uncharacterized protein n=1 Tax=Croceicoccus naphthovorans TaxID=1348774 RepID=A0A0G3XG92_9SPHN|nr:hypothetical protein [Croceicoccus naphthovorans]AKM09418.1 hypothetical protein AB433_04545 [Croceicoccus naphthovorans]MBB3992261.1 hypothetical protein [Croceicoccus naphthovorans]